MKACMRCYSEDNLSPVALYTNDKDLYMCNNCLAVMKTFTEYASLKKAYMIYKKRDQKLKELGI